MTCSLTPESFEKLLTWLDSNREEAAVEYENIRLRLIKFFICNGCGDRAEDLADETFDRFASRLDQGEVPEPFTGDKRLYFFAFARNIRLENFRKRLDVPPPPPVSPDTTEDESECLIECLEECVKQLPREEDRSLAIDYYSCDKSTKIEHHKKLAKKLGLGLPGLRTRIHRIREALRPCIEECLKRLLG